ncbi:MAG: hypothetical protein JJT78_12555 [Leptospira sp.]|nr:hypothetical protein [Leptospira sp.]
MESSETKRIATTLDDIEIIREISINVWNLLKKDFLDLSSRWKEITKVTILEDSWPRKFIISHKEMGDFEGILSEMGSLTLRPNFGKKQPIFYMSLAKLSNGSFIWEDENQTGKDLGEWIGNFEKAVENLKKYPL